jgi:hypothetical protein
MDGVAQHMLSVLSVKSYECVTSGGSTYFGPVEVWARRALKMNCAQRENFWGLNRVNPLKVCNQQQLFLSLVLRVAYYLMGFFTALMLI